MTASAQDTRSQLRNRELALERLAERLGAALEVAAPAHGDAARRHRRAAAPGRQERRSDVKRARRRPSATTRGTTERDTTTFGPLRG